MPKFLYLECLDHKETSRPVGPVDHPYVVEDMANIRSFARTLRNAELIKGSRVPFRRSVCHSESLRVYSGVEIH